MYDWTTFAGFPEEPMPQFDFTCQACGVDFIATGIHCRCCRCGSRKLTLLSVESKDPGDRWYGPGAWPILDERTDSG